MPLVEMDVKQSASVHSLKDRSLADVVAVVLRVGSDAPDVEYQPRFLRTSASSCSSSVPGSSHCSFSINSIKRVNYKSISVDGFFSHPL